MQGLGLSKNIVSACQEILHTERITTHDPHTLMMYITLVCICFVFAWYVFHICFVLAWYLLCILHLNGI